METNHDQKIETGDAAMAEKAVCWTKDAGSSDLPPVDRGHKAWLFLAGCYIMEALVFGTLILLLSLHATIP